MAEDDGDEASSAPAGDGEDRADPDAADREGAEAADLDDAEAGNPDGDGGGGVRAGRDLTSGSLLRPLLFLSAPIVGIQLLQVLYNLVDTFWVGQLGRDAVSAIAFAWPPIFVLLSLGGGATVAGSVLVAQYKGAGDRDRVAAVAGQTLAVTTLVAVAIGALGYVLTPTIIDWVGATPGSNAYGLAVEYTRVIFLGVWFTFAFLAFQALLRGWGDTRTPLYLLAASVGINVVLDPILIFGFRANPLFAMVGLSGLESSLYAPTGFEGFGIRGAAIATVLSRALAAVPGVALLFSSRLGISLSPADLSLDGETVRKIFAIGYPASIEQTSGALSYAAMTAVVALVGETAVAAFGISARLNSFVFLFAVGLGMGVETGVGQNLGARKVHRAKRVVFLTIAVVVGTYLLFTLVALAYARPLVGLFIRGAGASEVVDVGTRFLYIVAPTWSLLGVFHVIKGCLNGAGSTRAAMLLSVISAWVLQIVPAYALVAWTDVGIDGAWWGVALFHVGGAILMTAWFARGTWTADVVRRDADEGEDTAATD